MAQTEIEALCNAKIREKVEVELRIQPPPQRGCLWVWGCTRITWAEPESFPKCQQSQCQNEMQPRKREEAECMGEMWPWKLPSLEIEEICI